MTPSNKPVEVEQVVCEICLKEVPITEAVVPEASDYVVHFCGLECYAKWRKNPAGEAEDKPEEPAR